MAEGSGRLQRGGEMRIHPTLEFRSFEKDKESKWCENGNERDGEVKCDKCVNDQFSLFGPEGLENHPGHGYKRKWRGWSSLYFCNAWLVNQLKRFGNVRIEKLNRTNDVLVSVLVSIVLISSAFIEPVAGVTSGVQNKYNSRGERLISEQSHLMHTNMINEPGEDDDLTPKGISGIGNKIVFPGSIEQEAFETLKRLRTTDENDKIYYPVGSTGELRKSRKFKFPETDEVEQEREDRHGFEKQQEGFEDQGRKASPDVQDIIDGIVKLLGGQVRETTELGNLKNTQMIRTRPTMKPKRPTLTSTYNLFDPTSPIVTSERPNPPMGSRTRINDRGPPLFNFDGVSKDGELSTPTFEAIPIQAVNKELAKNGTKFGPPFPLQNPGPIASLETEPPYKQGVPIPEPIVPQFELEEELNDYDMAPPPKIISTFNPYNGEETGQPGTGISLQENSFNLNSDVNDPVDLTTETSSKSPEEEVTTPKIRFYDPVSKPFEDDEAEDESVLSTLQNLLRETQIGPDKLSNDDLEASLEASKDYEPPPIATPSLVNHQETMYLTTNKDTGFEIITQRTVTSSSSSEIKASRTYDGGLNLSYSAQLPQVKRPIYEYKDPVSVSKESNEKPSASVTTTTTTTTTRINLIDETPAHTPTPALKPGIVIHDGGGGKGYGSVEVVTIEEAKNYQNNSLTRNKFSNFGEVGEIFDVTVSAHHNFGQASAGVGKPFVAPVDGQAHPVITKANGDNQFVSIDGKKTYFNLQPTNAKPAASSGSTETPKSFNQKPPVKKKSENIGVGTVGEPVPLIPGPGNRWSDNNNKRPSVTSNPGAGKKSDKSSSRIPPNLIRRPSNRRPTMPPIRIDTCIVGDDSTCNKEQFEVCRTENGVSSCVCRAGYARRRHREFCKAVVALVLSIRLDKLEDKKLTYNADYFNPESDLYQTIEWETIHGLDSSLSDTTLSTGYIGSKLDAIGYDGRHAVVNATILIQDNPLVPAKKMKRELQKQMIHSLTRNRNNFGKSKLWVEGPISAVKQISDLNECEVDGLNDCHANAECINTLGSFECQCLDGYGDDFEHDKRKSGRHCNSCDAKVHCNGRGDCLIQDGAPVCRCAGNYYGSHCDIDGEVLVVAIGASAAAVIIIGLTLGCLCMWSRRWKKEEQKAALMSRTMFSGMASQALSYLSKNSINGTTNNPYQHVSLEDRLRWAQIADPALGGNIYVQNEQLSMPGGSGAAVAAGGTLGGGLLEAPSIIAARHSIENLHAVGVEDAYDERQAVKRPHSRASQIQDSIYYDLQGQGAQADMYGSRSMLSFPAQFCVPMSPLSHYATHTNRGFYN